MQVRHDQSVMIGQPQRAIGTRGQLSVTEGKIVMRHASVFGRSGEMRQVDLAQSRFFHQGLGAFGLEPFAGDPLDGYFSDL